MQNREVISRIKKFFKEVNADSLFTNKLAYSILLPISKLLIKRDSERLKILSQSSLFKPLKCVKVIEAPAIDPCCGIKSLCTVYRTEKRLPKIYTDPSGPIIRDVLTIDGSQSLTYIEPQEFERIKNNPWNKSKKKSKYYFYSDGYLYFPNGGYKMVEIIAFWEENINGWNECNKSTDNNDCISFLDQDFNIPGYLEEALFQMAEEKIKGRYSIPEKSHQIDKNDNTLNIQA